MQILPHLFGINTIAADHKVLLRHKILLIVWVLLSQNHYHCSALFAWFVLMRILKKTLVLLLDWACYSGLYIIPPLVLVHVGDNGDGEEGIDLLAEQQGLPQFHIIPPSLTSSSSSPSSSSGSSTIPHYPTIVTGPWPELTLMSAHRTEARPSAMKGVALTLGHDCRPFAVWHWAFILGSAMTIALTKIPPSFHRPGIFDICHVCVVVCCDVRGIVM